MTVPTGVLAAGVFGFAPPLSAAKREAIAQLPMALYNKMALVVLAQGDRRAGRPQRLGLDAQAPAVRRASCGPHDRDAAIVFLGGAQARQLEEEGRAPPAPWR